MIKSDQLKKFNPNSIFKSLKRLQPRNVGKTKAILNSKSKFNRHYFDKVLIRHAIVETFETFAKDTTIHGVKHFYVKFKENEVRGKSGKVILLTNKLIWGVSIVICAIFCLALMTLAYQNFFATLTITTIENINYPISEVAFPAVTFCSINKVYEPNTKEIWKLAETQGISNKSYFKYLKSLKKLSTFELESDEEVLGVEKLLVQGGMTIHYLMKEVSQPCTGLLMHCEIHGTTENCDHLFRKIRSSEGFCCSFNYYALRDRFELGNNNNSTTEAHDHSKLTLNGAGKYVGLTVHLNTSIESYLSPSHPFYGTIVIVHRSDNYPEFTRTDDLVQPGQEVKLAVVPTAIVSTDNVHNMPVDQRYCLFPEEREIALSEDYTFSNCLSECRARVIMKICKCIPYYYPTFDKTVAATPVCRLNDTPCLYRNRRLFQSLHVSSEEFLRANMNKTSQNGTSQNGLECDCLPTCSSLKYEVERFTGNVTKHPTLGNHSIVHVFFNALTCIKYRRDICMTWDGLLSTFGGMFSLCLGGSIMSIIEFLYFWTYYFYLQMHKQIVKLKFKAITRLMMLKRTDFKLAQK